MGHTEGPWKLRDYHAVEDSRPHQGVWANAYHPGHMLAYVSDTHDEDAANARLIAAAPDLLEACNGIIEAVPLGVYKQIDAIDAVREAIKKTESPSPPTVRRGLMPEKEANGVRYRVNLSTTSKGLPAWDCTVEFAGEVPDMELRQKMLKAVLEEVDILSKELSSRYPEGTPL